MANALRAQVEGMSTAMAALRGEVTTARDEVKALRASEAELRTRVEGLKASMLDLNDRSIQYNILQREVDTNRTLYDGLLQRYKEINDSIAIIAID